MKTWWNSIMTSHRASTSSSGLIHSTDPMDGIGLVPIIPGIVGDPIIPGELDGMTHGIPSAMAGIVLSTGAATIGAGVSTTGIIPTGGPVSMAGITGTIGHTTMLTGDIVRGLTAFMALAADPLTGMLALPITVIPVAV